MADDLEEKAERIGRSVGTIIGYSIVYPWQAVRRVVRMPNEVRFWLGVACGLSIVTFFDDSFARYAWIAWIIWFASLISRLLCWIDIAEARLESAHTKLEIAARERGFAEVSSSLEKKRFTSIELRLSNAEAWFQYLHTNQTEMDRRLAELLNKHAAAAEQ